MGKHVGGHEYIMGAEEEVEFRGSVLCPNSDVYHL